MKKKHIFLVALGVILMIGILVFYFNQNLLKTYHISTPSNEPALKYGSIVVGSSLWKPKKNDFVLFKRIDSVFGKGIYIFRLVATEGDTIRIKDGTTYINSSNIDSSLTLKHAYIVPEKQMNNNLEDPNYYDAYPMQTGYWVQLVDSIAKSAGHERIPKKVNEADPSVSTMFNANWNANYFGPLVIPENKIFVMGDNRDNAMDSRYIGLIDVDDIVGVVRSNQ